jgi:hypothetical protein
MNKKLTAWLRAASLVISTGIFLSATTPSANAFQTELGIGYPVGTGSKELSPNIDLNVSFYFDRFIDPKIDNFVSIGYDSFALLADSGASFRVFPLLVGIELPGKVFTDLNVTFGAAIGAAFGYINVPNINSTNVTAYFDAQIRPGLEYIMNDSFSILAKTPINFMIGKGSFTYVIYDFGVKFKL